MSSAGELTFSRAYNDQKKSEEDGECPLFGSVTKEDIVSSLEKFGIDKSDIQNIELDQPLKRTGSSNIKINGQKVSIKVIGSNEKI